jgi:diguanylate cyclase (GGDEF)-like protein
VHELSSTDSLTGLRNRRVQETLEEELKRARRHEGLLSFLLIDVDAHKVVVTSLATAPAISSCGGRRALSARLPRDRPRRPVGRRRVLLLAPDTSAEDAPILADRIRSFLADAAGEPAMTVSVGVATVRPSEVSATAEDLVGVADAALYAAKRLGRDRVIIG